MESTHPFAEAWGRFKKNRTAFFATIFLGVLYFICLLAPFFSPYNSQTQHLDAAYHKPVGVHVFDAEGVHWPFVYKYELIDKARQIYTPIVGKRYPLRFFGKGDAYKLLGLIPMTRHFVTVDAPGRLHFLGTDLIGRDVLSRLLVGSQVSLSIGFLGILISFPLALLIGGISAYVGGKVDASIMRFLDVLMAIPGLYLVLTIRYVFPQKLSSIQIYLIITMIFSLIDWAGMSRVIRGIGLSEKERAHVYAARCLGQSPGLIIWRHIIPATFAYCIVAATLSIPGYILGEATLSYLNLGIQEPDASWGLMLAQAQSIRVFTQFWWILSPGVAIFIVVLAFNYVGEGLRDALDPKMKVVRS
ncbi:MAG: ABC transporter permease [Verrucomicrobiota bacterium]|nr:ABC transporter permease [Verrucomicrobiota bacterium]